MSTQPPYLQKSEGLSSNAEGRLRDERIIEFRLFWIQLLLEMGLFRDRSTAAKRLRRLQRKREVYFVDRFELQRNSKMHFMFASRRIKADTIRGHEVPISLLLSKYFPYCEDFKRLYDVDTTTRPDATFTMNGVSFNLEFYTEHQSRAQIEARLKHYEGTDQAVLIVARKQARLTAIREATPEGVRHLCAYAMLDDVLRDPFGKVWWSYGGTPFGVPQGALHPAHKYLHKPPS